MCKQKQRYRWMEKNIIPSILVIIVIVATPFFLWNLFSANISSNPETNRFTVLSGWVSFLGTLLVGVIAIVQTEIYSRKTSETNDKTSQLTKSIADTNIQIAQLSKSIAQSNDKTVQLTELIKDYIWKLNLPVLEISSTDSIINFYQNKGFPNEELPGNIYKTEPNCIIFNLCKESDNRFKDCQLIYSEKIECTIVNKSNNDINSISIIDFKKRENSKQSSYPIDLSGFSQGHLGSHMSSKLIFKIYSSEKIYDSYYDDFLELIFTLQVTDVNGDKSKRTFQILVSSMQKYQEYRKGIASMNYFPSVRVQN